MADSGPWTPGSSRHPRPLHDPSLEPFPGKLVDEDNVTEPKYDINHLDGDEPNTSEVNQLDGADTASESSDNSDYEDANSSNYNIPVVTSMMTRAPRPERNIPPTLRKIVRNERMNISATLPTVAVANVRSLQTKLNSVIEKVENENLDICLLVEIWEKTGKKE